jgi:hypothetical protein
MENVETKMIAGRAVRPTQLQLAVLVVAVVVASFAVAWLLVTSGGSKSSLPAPNGGPALVSQAQLEHLAGSTDHPVYWAGPKDGSYELTRTSNGRIFVRYLPRGVKAGDARPDFLTVGTYSQSNGFAELKRVAKQKDSVSITVKNGGLVVFNKKKPTNVYFAYPDGKYQVEVFSPSADAARSLVLTGQIKPIK